jgi:hypothetical protein
MRLWSIHPRYLDRQGLIALWREALLAQKVLAGKTRGYRHHPQLMRFRGTREPLKRMGAYLKSVETEALRRGYEFDPSKILVPPSQASQRFRMAVTRGQLVYETQHLLLKLKKRDRFLYRHYRSRKFFAPHPLFKVVPGAIEDWERT